MNDPERVETGHVLFVCCSRWSHHAILSSSLSPRFSKNPGVKKKKKRKQTEGRIRCVLGGSDTDDPHVEVGEREHVADRTVLRGPRIGDVRIGAAERGRTAGAGAARACGTAGTGAATTTATTE